ncbi:nucleotidyltransferase family protein [Luteibacter yeojuensis]|uniref:Nucleotidyltransferase family protein n=1 Tax=Luteibacter yeojuensis TaxID=345309 RepID=A0A7X5QV77_9GAMM|nr:nucleotidyltransferase family protein [Luteibacter yeojuensis]NID15930.1 nucleotidyltransferase family protein [Luteibacter yeojuensis]
MTPPLKLVRRGLHDTTEILAAELALAQPGTEMPAWNELEWRLATAAAVAHGISPLLCRFSTWQRPAWRRFLVEQRGHVAQRHERIATLLRQIDAEARAASLPLMALKGAALHALGLYAAGDRPMADIDLLVDDAHADATANLLASLGYEASFTQWKHRVFKPAGMAPVTGLGEHRDTPVNIELHTRIHERLPVATVDITAQVRTRDASPGINPYPSMGALMSHLLLHAAGNICGRSLRLIHLNDIALLATRMTPSDWEPLWSGGAPWWALPPLRLVARYYRDAVPGVVLARLERDCPLLLRAFAHRQTLTRLSCSNLWLDALPGLEWTRSPRDAVRYLKNRLRPTQESVKERADMVRTQAWLQGQDWVTLGHRRRLLTWLTRPVPRMDTLYVVRKALEHGTPLAG